MSVAVIIVGIDGWEKFTLPCINSIKACEPKAKIIYIDNGSKEEPYPILGPKTIPLGIDDTVSYAEALNIGLAAASGIAKWYLICNNDVLFRKPFVKRVQGFNPKELYGFYVHKIGDREYLPSWLMILNKKLVEDVGMFDENFTPMMYEDADYSFRAEDAGYGLLALDRRSFGAVHLHDNPKIDGATTKKMLDYLKAKHGIK